MLNAGNDAHSQQNLSRLSEVVIEALREISIRKLPLGASTLCEVLKNHRDIGRVLPAGDHFEADQGDQGLPTRRELCRLKDEIRGLKKQKERLARELNEQEDLKNQNDQFYRRSLLTMVSMTMNPVDARLEALLLQFRELLKAGGDLATVKELYQAIKDTVLAQGVSDAIENNGAAATGSLWDRAFSGRKQSRSHTAMEEGHCKDIQQLYQDILALILPLQQDVSFQQRARALQVMLRNRLSPEHLVSLRREMVFLLDLSLNRVLEEKKQIESFLSEMGRNLTQIESLLLSSLDGNVQNVNENMDFGRLIEGHMEDIRVSLATTDNLAGLKRLVLSKMTTIRAALEAKRLADQRQLELANERLGGLQQRMQSVLAEIAQVQKQARMLEEEVRLDPLTGVHNRRAYESRMNEEFQRFQRYGQVFSLLLFDVDEFKEVNDRYGHMAGDKCLKEIARRISNIVRITDFVARFGGDEFVILLPGIDREKLAGVAEKVRASIETLRFLYQGQPIELSLSLGGAVVSSVDPTPESLFSRADGALFEAKKGGRNRAVLA